MGDKKIAVEVAYATPEEQVIIPVQIAEAADVESAIVASGVLEQFSDIDLSRNKVGIFGKACKLDRVLQSGERVEIYRALIADPKAIRKERASKAK
ncbi:MAG: RnfH family protein [Gammaproteobacteria bacterium]|nr:MAG: RnfH family protein [Gammaproteobacteria bacterium]RLA20938.1 MAG: RnfH family protein [Gammaproteobacteria bacterium]